MAEAKRPKEAQKAVARLSTKAQEVALIRNCFAHGPLDMGINFETKKYEVYLRQVSVDRKTLTFQTTPLTHEELQSAQKEVSELYLELIKITRRSSTGIPSIAWRHLMKRDDGLPTPAALNLAP
jgi:hypothetical protein